MPAKKPKPDEKPQRERFIEAAREAEADETQEGFDRAFNNLGLKPIKPTSKDTD
jgi:hypothetical protein